MIAVRSSSRPSEYLGTTERHMRRLRYERRITSFKVGGKVRFDLIDLDAYVEAQKDEAENPDGDERCTSGWRARRRTPDGRSGSKNFGRKIDAERHLTSVEHTKLAGIYVDP